MTKKKQQGCVITPAESKRRLRGRTVTRIYSLDEVLKPAWATPAPKSKERKNG